MDKRPEYNLAKTGERIRILRKERNISVEQIRKYLQFESTQAIYKWENGKCFPQADNLLALAKLFKVSPTEILVEKSGYDEIIRIILCFMKLRRDRCYKNVDWSFLSDEI